VRAPDGVALRDGSGTDPRLFLVPYPVVRRRLRLDASPGDQPLRPHALFDPVLLWCATILPAAKQALADIHPDAARRGRRADHHGLSAFPLQAPTAWCAADNPPPPPPSGRRTQAASRTTDRSATPIFRVFMSYLRSFFRSDWTYRRIDPTQSGRLHQAAARRDVHGQRRARRRPRGGIGPNLGAGRPPDLSTIDEASRRGTQAP
jgi:hypothetical protein